MIRITGRTVQPSVPGYDLPGGEYYDFQDLDRATVRCATAVEFPSPDRLKSYIAATEDIAGLKRELYTVGDSDTQYIAVRNGSDLYLKKVNIFKLLYSNPDSEDIDIQMKIIPAGMIASSVSAGQRQGTGSALFRQYSNRGIAK